MKLTKSESGNSERQKNRSGPRRKPILTRMLIAIIVIPIMIIITYLGGISFLLMVLIAAVISINEFYNMMRVRSFLPAYYVGNFFTIFFIVFAYYATKKNWEPAHSAILTSAALITMIATLFLKRGKEATIDTALTLMGMIYIGWFFSYTIFIRALTAHGAYFYYLATSVMVLDSSAYFVGKMFGKHKLFPSVSPKKSIEGAIGAFGGSIFVGIVFAYVLKLPYIHFFILSILIGIMAQLGDLFESLIKRDAGVKDSSNLIPGHGGLLDRADSFIFASPIVYYYVVWFMLK